MDADELYKIESQFCRQTKELNDAELISSDFMETYKEYVNNQIQQNIKSLPRYFLHKSMTFY